MLYWLNQKLNHLIIGWWDGEIIVQCLKNPNVKKVTLVDIDKKVIAKRQIIDRIKHHTTQSLDATSYDNLFNMFFIVEQQFAVVIERFGKFMTGLDNLAASFKSIWL